jgi:hypothetical protein
LAHAWGKWATLNRVRALARDDLMTAKMQP